MGNNPAGSVARTVARNIVGVLTIAALLLVSAGSLHWWAGYSFLGVALLAQIGIVVAVPLSLLRERTKRQHAGQEAWDRFLYAGFGQLTARVMPIVAGLDFRFGWSSGISWRIKLVALAFLVLGWALFIWSMRVNAFFSALVRIQTDRGHQVVSSGPYSVVRHPGYVGLFIITIAGPVLLGSIWAILVGAIAVVSLAARTVLEDRLLRRDLPGYSEYAQRVRWRLIPRIW